jgi:hypothetical protein
VDPHVRPADPTPMKAVIDRHTVNEAWLKTRASRAIVDKVVKSMAATKGVIGIEFGNLDSAGPLILASRLRKRRFFNQRRIERERRGALVVSDSR